LASKALAGAAIEVRRDRAIRAETIIFMAVLRVWKPTSSALHVL
jgi:hypothetical protein